MIAITKTAAIGGTINSDQLQEIKDDNRHLRDVRIALRALLCNPLVLRNHLNRMIDLLGELRDQLAIHFALEEVNGYFSDVIDATPRLSVDAERLRNEHAALFATIVDIAEQADQLQFESFSQVRINRVVGRIKEFEARLCEHEEGEKRVVFEALDRDIGGEG